MPLRSPSKKRNGRYVFARPDEGPYAKLPKIVNMVTNPRLMNANDGKDNANTTLPMALTPRNGPDGREDREHHRNLSRDLAQRRKSSFFVQSSQSKPLPDLQPFVPKDNSYHPAGLAKTARNPPAADRDYDPRNPPGWQVKPEPSKPLFEATFGQPPTATSRNCINDSYDSSRRLRKPKAVPKHRTVEETLRECAREALQFVPEDDDETKRLEKSTHSTDDRRIKYKKFSSKEMKLASRAWPPPNGPMDLSRRPAEAEPDEEDLAKTQAQLKQIAETIKTQAEKDARKSNRLRNRDVDDGFVVKVAAEVPWITAEYDRAKHTLAEGQHFDLSAQVHLRAPNEAKAKRLFGISTVPLHIVCVLDVSTSMDMSEASGKSRIEYLKDAMTGLVEQLGEGDVLGIIAFDEIVRMELPMTTMANEDGVNEALDVIDALKTGPGTNVSDAMDLATELLFGRVDQMSSYGSGSGGGIKKSSKRKRRQKQQQAAEDQNVAPTTIIPDRNKKMNRAIFLFTDGPMTHGTVDATACAEGIQSKISSVGKGMPVRCYTFGLGTDHDAKMLDRVGPYQFLQDGKELRDAFDSALVEARGVVATNTVLNILPAPGVTIKKLESAFGLSSIGAHAIDLGDLTLEATRDVAIKVSLETDAMELDHDAKHGQFITAELTFTNVLRAHLKNLEEAEEQERRKRKKQENESNPLRSDDGDLEEADSTVNSGAGVPAPSSGRVSTDGAESQNNDDDQDKPESQDKDKDAIDRKLTLQSTISFCDVTFPGDVDPRVEATMLQVKILPLINEASTMGDDVEGALRLLRKARNLVAKSKAFQNGSAELLVATHAVLNEAVKYSNDDWWNFGKLKMSVLGSALKLQRAGRIRSLATVKPAAGKR